MNKDCVSLEVAKKLQEVGYKNRADYYYVAKAKDESKGYNLYQNPKLPWTPETYWSCEFLPAPTATQLAEELPAYLVLKGDVATFTIDKSEELGYACWYDAVDRSKSMKPQVSMSFPDCLGLMMCYFIENELLPR